MKKRQETSIRPVARRHQKYRILVYRRQRKTVYHINHAPEGTTAHNLKYTYLPTSYRYCRKHRRIPGKHRFLTPSARTRRRFLYQIVSHHVRQPDAFDSLENVLKDLETSVREFPVKSRENEDTFILPSIIENVTESLPTIPLKIRKSFRKQRSWILPVIVCLVICLSGLLIYRYVQSDSSGTSDIQASVSPSFTPTPSPLAEQLEPEISKMLSPLEGEWSCYVKDLHTGETILYNNQKQHSASLIKLFTAGCYEEELKEGTIQETDAGTKDEAMMISYSDNDAWVALETIIGQGSYPQGYQRVTQFARSHGFSDTGRLVDQNDHFAGYGGNNWTSVSDTGNCLDQIYHGTYVSKEASDRILNLMKEQVHVNKIPAGLPAGTICANKTGELNLTQNDAAIVYGPKTDYILVVMSDGMKDENNAIQQIVDLSSMVYHFMED